MSAHPQTVSVIGSTDDLVSVTSKKHRVNRTKTEKRLLVVVFLLLILILGLIIAIGIIGNRAQILGVPCVSKNCVDSAHALLHSIDQNAEPCRDFYQFACGNFKQNHPVTVPRLSSSWFSEASDYLGRQIKGMLETKNSKSDPTSIRQARAFYSSCMDTDRLDELGLEPLLQVLGNLSLPADIPHRKHTNNFRLAEVLSLIQRHTVLDIIIELSLESGNSSGVLLGISPPRNQQSSMLLGIMTDPEKLQKASELSAKEVLLAKAKYMIRMLDHFNTWLYTDENQLNATMLGSIAVKILLFEARIMEGVAEDDKRPVKKQMTLAQLQSIMDSELSGDQADSNKINWEEYLNILVMGVNITLDYHNDFVVVSDVPYFKYLAKLLATSKPETILRYVWWTVIQALAPFTDKTMRDIKHSLIEELVGSTPRSPRSDICMSKVKSYLPMTISHALLSKHPMKDDIEKVRGMLQDIQASFESIVQSNDWIDSEVKQRTVEKSSAISSFIGYPKWVLDPRDVDEYYSWVEVEEDEYLWNSLKMKAQVVVTFLGTLGPSDDDDYEDENDERDDRDTENWDNVDPLDVNAFYSRFKNAIVIPAGIMRFPFYGRGLEALNYGSIGTILGHELTHGFDSDGKDYDKFGKKRPWWKGEMHAQYNKRAQCFVHQYSNFQLGGKYSVNGNQTLAENIADNGGLSEAFRAYRRYVDRHGKEPPLPGLEQYSHEQLLFLAFANLWCYDTSAEYDAFAVKDTHSPSKFRVLGSLRNSPEFAEAWHCKRGSPMNPDHKCILW